jgi:hypothetical protein
LRRQLTGSRARTCAQGAAWRPPDFALGDGACPGLIKITEQIPERTMFTKLSPPVIGGQEDQTLRSHRSRRCVRVCDGTGKSGTDEQ